MPDALHDWVPERVFWQEGGPRVQWIHSGGRRFTEPFFQDTVSRFRCAPSAAVIRRRTSMEELLEWTGAHAGLRPAGFVFHMSRSGSTLISQMLAAADGNRVMSEATPLDDVLRQAFRRPVPDEEQVAAWLRAMVSALGQGVAGEHRFFLKWDCWHVHQLGLIRRAFPKTPWIFVYRNPVEVLVSQMRNPGAWTVPGALDAELTGEADGTARREVYVVQLLAGICRAAIEQRATLVNYDELPEAVCGRLARYFGVEFTDGERRQMSAAAEWDTKNPLFRFEEDATRKRREVSADMAAAVERWMGGIYDELERLRKAGQGLPE